MKIKVKFERLLEVEQHKDVFLVKIKEMQSVKITNLFYVNKNKSKFKVGNLKLEIMIQRKMENPMNGVFK